MSRPNACLASFSKTVNKVPEYSEVFGGEVDREEDATARNKCKFRNEMGARARARALNMDASVRARSMLLFALLYGT